MIDFVLGIALAAMLVRGWVRGFVRESLDLISLIAGVWIAFRLSAPFGDFLTDSFGVAPELARIGGGIALFVLFGASLSVAAHYLSKVMNLPGLSMVNRVGGAVVAVGWGVLVVLVAVSVVRVLPIPDSWRGELDDSTIVDAVASDDAVPNQVFQTVAGDNVMGAMASIRELFGESRVVPEEGETLQIPPAGSDEIRQDRDAAERVLESLNEYRVGRGLRALQQVSPMTDFAEGAAAGFYVDGTLRRLADCQDSLADRSYIVVRCGSGVALASTALGAYDGVLEAEYGPDLLGNPDMDRVGLAVVDGPTGQLLVLLLGG